MQQRSRTILASIQLLGAGLLGLLAYCTPTPVASWEQARYLSRRASQPLETPGLAEGEVAGDCDRESLRQLRDSLDGIATGLNAMAGLLDDSPTKQLGRGLAETAAYLDSQVQAAESAARRLEETGSMLRADSLRLAELLRSAPLDMEAVKQVHEALGRFAAGTEALGKVLELPRLPEIRTGLQGLEKSLSTGATQVESLASYTYPVVYWESWRPHVYQKQFWPTGDKIALGLTEAATGLKAADSELESLTSELPRIRAALDSSRQILDRSHDTLGTVLKYRGLIEPLVKSLPETAARLADDLPRLTQQLAATLRETRRLREVAISLRGTQEQLERSVAGWAAARETILQAAAGVKANRDRLDRCLLTSSDQRSSERELAGELSLLADLQASEAERTAAWIRLVRGVLLVLALLTAVHGTIGFLASRRPPQPA